MNARQCPNCGAAVDLPPEVVADLCAFCSTPLVDVGADVEPADRVAPFRLTKQAAADRLGDVLQAQWLAPEAVRTAGTPERLRGVLVPFWSYEAVARSEWSARIGVWWYRTEVYTTTEMVDGKPKTVTRTRRVRETEWFPSSGTHVATYTDHLVSGSRGLSEAEANALEPFDLGPARGFAAELLAGWTAERATISHEEAVEVASAELGERQTGAIGYWLPGDEFGALRVRTRAEVRRAELVLLPVWIATYAHQGEIFRLLVNGQTGEVVGKAPRSTMKVVGLVLAVIGVLLALASIPMLLESLSMVLEGGG